jgi:hypothetical protein
LAQPCGIARERRPNSRRCAGSDAVSPSNIAQKTQEGRRRNAYREGILDRRVQGVAAACGEDGRDCSGEIRFVAGVRSSPAGDALKHLHRCVDCRRTACCSCAGLPEAGLDPVDFIRARTRVAGCAVPPAVAAVWN